MMTALLLYIYRPVTAHEDLGFSGFSSIDKILSESKLTTPNLQDLLHYRQKLLHHYFYL